METEVQHLPALPANTDLRSAIFWSRWGDTLAIVDTDHTWFRPDTMEREYRVRLALDLYDRRPIVLSDRAFGEAVGRDVRVREPYKPYHETMFTIGTGYVPICTGTFEARTTHYRVKVALGNLTAPEHRVLRAHLRAQGYRQIETKKGIRAVEKLLRRSFTDLQADHYEIANEADRILRGTGYDTCATDEGCNDAWRDLGTRGVYLETRAGLIKAFLRTV